MMLLRRLAIALSIGVLVFGIFWVWWNKSSPTDMAAYAPADSLVYLESNSISNIVTGITGTNAWQKLGPHLHIQRRLPSPWIGRFVKWTGIGPVETVVAIRSQIAVVMLNVEASEQGATLKVKPDAAIIVDTHTPSWRIRPATEQLVGELAKTLYGTPSFSKHTTSGVEYLVWSAPSGSRQIIATVDDSVVFIGNSESAVSTCLAVKRGQRPSLQNGPELQRMRVNLRADQALTFGYVSSANAGRLAAVAVPLLVGSESGDFPLERLLTDAAPKVLGSIGWSSFASKGGIEDRYLFSIKDPVNGRLVPLFRPASSGREVVDRFVPGVHSISVYKFESSLEAWQGFESAILSQLDALSAVVFRSLWKSSLLRYGIDEPEEFLRLVGAPLATVRVRPTAEGSVLVAAVREQESVKRFVNERLGAKITRQVMGSTEVLEVSDRELAAAISDKYVLLGPPEDVRTCVTSLNSNRHDNQPPDSYGPALDSSTISTYTDDSARVRTLMNAVARAVNYTGSQPDTETLERAVAELPYSITETALSHEGLERRTQSSFGQFSTLASLLFPDSP